MKKLLVLLMALSMSVFFVACGGEKNDVSISGDYQSESRQEDNTQEPKPQTTQDENGTIGDYDVSIINSEMTTSKQGKKAILVTYSFTNNSDKVAKFAEVLSAEAYQNNEACAQAGMTNQDYDIETMLAEVNPGETKEVYEAYLLKNESDVTIKVTKAGQTTKEEQTDTSMITRVFKVE